MTTRQKNQDAQARLEARISTDLHALLKRAAALQGRSMTDFVITAVERAARRAVEDAEILRLSAEDQARFARALIDPPAPVAALKRAAKHHRDLTGPR